MKNQSSYSSGEVLTEINDICVDVLKKMGMSNAIAHTAGLEISDRVSRALGGQNIYFKQYKQDSVDERNLALIEDYESGEFSIRELSAKYAISYQWVYRIIANHEKKSKEISTNEPNS